MSRREPEYPQPERRDVSVGALLVCLRSALGLSPHETAPGELAASRGRTLLPPTVRGVDAGAWIAWAVVGLSLFAKEPLPSMGETLAEARRVLLALALERTGSNITIIGKALQMSRRAVREHLQSTGLYRSEHRTDGPVLSAVVDRDDRGEPDGI